MENENEKRLWVGNLDSRINEYQLLKLLRKYGTIDKFDMLYHKTGPLAGQPRGYAFVSYKSKEESEKAMEELNGQLVGSKKLIVTHAHNMPEVKKESKTVELPVLGGSKPPPKISISTQITAIEAKLKMMEQNKDDIEINRTVANETPVIVKKDLTENVKQQSKDRYYKKPYNKPNRRFNKR